MKLRTTTTKKIPVAQHWWNVKGQCHADVFRTVERIDKAQSTRASKRATWLSLYEGREIPNLSPSSWSNWAPSDVLQINVIQSIIDSVTAKIATSKPRPLFVTSGGDLDMKERAKGLTYLVEGIYHQAQVYKQAPMVFRDACISELGGIKVFPDHDCGKVRVERVLAKDLFVDVMDGLHGTPRTLYQHMTASRYVVEARYSLETGDLEDAELVLGGDDADTVDEPISVIEAWHLPSSEDAKDGRRVVCTSNRTIVDEPWEFEKFPVAIFRWMPRVIGWHGLCLAEQLQPIQGEISFVAQKIQRLLNLSTTRVFLQQGSKVNPAELTNEEFSTVEYTGNAPIFSPDAGAPAQLFQWLWDLYGKAYEIAGISQLFASSVKPAGLNSAVAQREYKDTESQRFLEVGQNWDEFLGVEVPELIVEAARSLYEKGGKFRVMAVADKKLKQIDWSKIAIKRGEYQIQTWPTNLLPRTPAGRLETIRELMEIFPGIQDVAPDLLDFPDVDAALSNLNAPLKAVDAHIQAILDRDYTVRPEPFMDLNLTMKRVLAAYLRTKNDGAPQEMLDAFVAYLTDTQDLIQMQAQPAQPAQMGPEMMGEQMGAKPMPSLGPMPTGGAEMSPEVLAALAQGAAG